MGIKWHNLGRELCCMGMKLYNLGRELCRGGFIARAINRKVPFCRCYVQSNDMIKFASYAAAYGP